MNKHLGKLEGLNWTSKFHLATWGMILVRSAAGLLVRGSACKGWEVTDSVHIYG